MDTGRPAKPEHEHDVVDSPPSVTDEELFEAYLAARLEQALDTLNRAREELAAQPEDFSRALQVMRRVYELRELRAQLESQRSRVAAARNAAGLEPASAGEPQQVEQPTASPGFRAVQSEQADKVMAALTTRPRTCPSCQALLSIAADHCRCGYTVEAGSESPQPDAPALHPIPDSPRTAS